jgi:hypothetical protein
VRSLSLALSVECRIRAPGSLRPRFVEHGAGRFALAARGLDGSLARLEHAVAQQLEALRRETEAAMRRRIQRLPATAFEAFARAVLEANGWRDLAQVRRSDDLALYSARHPARRPVAVVIRSGTHDAGRRTVAAAREMARAAGLSEVLLVTAGRLVRDGLLEVASVIDADGLVEMAWRSRVGVSRAPLAVSVLDLELFEAFE